MSVVKNFSPSDLSTFEYTVLDNNAISDITLGQFGYMTQEEFVDFAYKALHEHDMNATEYIYSCRGFRQTNRTTKSSKRIGSILFLSAKPKYTSGGYMTQEEFVDFAYKALHEHDMNGGENYKEDLIKEFLDGKGFDFFLGESGSSGRISSTSSATILLYSS